MITDDIYNLNNQSVDSSDNDDNSSQVEVWEKFMVAGPQI